jgi:hypothetical protein
MILLPIIPVCHIVDNGYGKIVIELAQIKAQRLRLQRFAFGTILAV